MAKTKLTPEILSRRWKSMEEFYRQRNINMLAYRQMYLRTPEQYFVDVNKLYVEPEKDERRIILPIAQQYVDTMMELMLTKPPAISVPSDSSVGEDSVTADHNEKTLLATWYASNIYQSVKDSLWHGFVDGWGVIQLALEDRDDTCPVYTIAQDPYNVYACPGSRPDSWQYVIHAYPRTVAEIRDQWQYTQDRRTAAFRKAETALADLEDADRVMYIEYWDGEWFAVAVNWEEPGRELGSVVDVTSFVVEPTEHKFGFLPWYIFHPTRTPFRQIGERVGLSILYGIEDMVRELCFLVSKKETMLYRWQDPPLVTKTEDGRDFDAVRTQAGMQLKLLTEEDAFYLVNPSPMPQLDSQIARLEDYIERGSVPRVLQGQYVGAVSGIAMNLLRNPTLMEVGFKQKTLEYTLRQLNEGILRLWEKHGKKTELWAQDTVGDEQAVAIDPKRIKGKYHNSVKLSASLPTDDAATINMLATLVQLGVLSAESTRDVVQQTLHELVPQSLPDEQERILAEKILQDPAMVQQLSMQMAKKVFGHLLPKPEGTPAPNPMGGRGPREVRMPSQTLPAQVPGMPGGNAAPDMAQRLGEMMENAPIPPEVRQ